MSPLTKLFVVLLVIVSMLNAAAIVVFVNKIQPVQKQLDASQQALQEARSLQAVYLTAKHDAENQAANERNLREADQRASAAAITALQNHVNDDQLKIADLSGKVANLQAGMNTANANVELTASTTNKLQGQVDDLRKSNDTLLKQNNEYSQHNAELTSTLETAQAKLQDTQEQLQASKEKSDQYAAFITGKGYNINQAAPLEANYGPSNAAINGVVNEKSVINGNTFVTISVGSADGVEKGMKFYVVDGSQFLGTVTIDTVDTDDAIGRLDGPGVAQVRKGTEVKTQLRG